MGGIIAVDFIDMGQVENRKLTEARKAMKPDKAANVLARAVSQWWRSPASESVR